MKQPLKRGLGWKFSLVLVVTVALFGISAYIVGHGMDLIRQNILAKDRIQNQALALSELTVLYQGREMALQNYLINQQAQELQRYEELSGQAEETARQMIFLETSEEQKRRLEDLLAKDGEYRELAAAGRMPSDQASALRDEIFALLEKLLEEEKAQLARWEDQTYSQLKGNTLVLLFSIAVSAIVGLTLVVMVSQNVRRSLHEVVRMADEIAKKNLRVHDMDYWEKDEIGHLAHSMNRMKWTLKNVMTQLTGTAELVAGESGKLMRFSGHVGNGSREISATMEELSVRSRNQAETSSLLMRRMDHFSEQITSIVREKDELGALSGRMLALTEEGGARMASSLDKMNAIDTSINQSLALVRQLDEKTAQISEIVQIIREIADQTHLLSLNAAIEAARAGEQGRSFAVVAENVRKLSEKVKTSVAEVAAAAAEIQQSSQRAVMSLDEGYRTVTEGKVLVYGTSETFLHLQAEIGQTGAQIETMSAALDEIRKQAVHIQQFLKDTAALSEETAAGVSEVSFIAGEFRQLIEEVTGSVSDLDREAGKLNGMITQFQL